MESKHPTPWTYDVGWESERSYVRDANGIVIIWGDRHGLQFNSLEVRDAMLQSVNERPAILAVAEAARALFAADHHDHFAARMSDSEMEAIDRLKAALAALETK